MSIRLIVFAFFSSVLMFSPAHADEDPAGSASSDVTTSSAMEERIRAHREQFDQRNKEAELLRQQHQAELDELREERQTQMQEQRDASRVQMQEQRDTSQAQMEGMRAQPPMQGQRSVTERQLAMQKYRDQQRTFYEKQQQEREALAAKWREARQKYMEARMDTFLKQREERLAFMVKQQEAMRNRAEDRHNHLVENQDDIMEGMLEEQVNIASRHEELRKQADERRRKMTVMRATLMDMAPEERRAYIEKHREELFGARSAQSRAGGMPAPPPWAQHRMRPSAPPAPATR